MASARETFVELGDAAMIVDCDVTTMEQLLLAGRTAEVASMRDDVASMLDAADVPVLIDIERVAGQLEVLDGVDQARSEHDALVGRLGVVRTWPTLTPEIRFGP